jgi:hypothetical protein
MMLTNHFHPVQRLKTEGAVRLCSLHACMAWIGTTLPFLNPINNIMHKKKHNTKNSEEISNSCRGGQK